MFIGHWYFKENLEVLEHNAFIWATKISEICKLINNQKKNEDYLLVSTDFFVQNSIISFQFIFDG